MVSEVSCTLFFAGLNVFAGEALADNHSCLMVVEAPITHAVEHGQHGIQASCVIVIMFGDHLKEIGVIPFKFGELLLDLVCCASAFSSWTRFTIART